MSQNNDIESLINKAANDVMLFSRSNLIVNLRFLDIAIGRLQLVRSENATMGTDGIHLIYGPRHIL